VDFEVIYIETNGIKLHVLLAGPDDIGPLQTEYDIYHL